MRYDNEIHESDAKTEIQSFSKIERLKSFGFGRASKQPGFFSWLGKIELYECYIADLLVHDINKVKRLHKSFVYLSEIAPLLTRG